MVTLIVHLFVAAGKEAAFEAYERQALAIVRRHGGVLVTAVRPRPLAAGARPLTDGERTPFEIHVLTFPSLAHFQAFQADEELIALRPLRGEAIEATQIYLAEETRVYP